MRTSGITQISDNVAFMILHYVGAHGADWTSSHHYTDGLCGQSCPCCRARAHDSEAMEVCWECEALLNLKNASRHMRELLRGYDGR